MKKIIFILLGLAPIISFGQLDRSIVPTAGKAPIINIEDSEVFTAANGMTVILSEDHKLPRVTFDLVVGPGPKMENGKAGLSEIAGALILSGTSTYTKDELDRKIDYIGARLNADKNSLTLSCLTKHMDKGLDLMSDVLMNANFPQEEFDRIVDQYKSNLMATKSDPNQMAQNAVASVNFPNHPFGEVMTEESLLAITQEDVKAFYNATFVPYQSYLVIVGDINRAEAEKIVASYFSKWNGTKFMTPEYTGMKSPSESRVIFAKKPGAVQSAIFVTFPMDIKPGSEDQIPLSVLNGLFGGGGFGSRLMQNLREDKAYTYGCYSSTAINKEGSWMSAGGNFRTDVSDSAITQILFEMDRLTNEYVTDEELALIKSSMAGSFARSLERPSTIARFALNIIRYDLDKNYYKEYLQKLASVSKEDVLAMAQKYFNAKKCNIVVVGNEDVIERLKAFDTDGKIELVDAFGNEVNEMKPATISADQLLCDYVKAVTKSSSTKEVTKKLKKVKSVKQEIEFAMAQMPMPLKSTSIWAAPNSEAMKLEAQGMVLQKTYFDGTEGYNSNMQTGKTAMTEEEIASKNKSTGLFPEWNYSTSGIEYKLLGIETDNGKDMYVLNVKNGDVETFDYFDTETFMKVKSLSIDSSTDEPTQSSTTYTEYMEVDGFMFPSKLQVSMGEVSLTGEAKSIEINSGKLADFK